MLITKRRILKSIKREYDLSLMRTMLCGICKLNPTIRLVELWKEVDNWFYDHADNAIKRYTDLSIVKRL